MEWKLLNISLLYNGSWYFRWGGGIQKKALLSGQQELQRSSFLLSEYLAFQDGGEWLSKITYEIRKTLCGLDVVVKLKRKHWWDCSKAGLSNFQAWYWILFILSVFSPLMTSEGHI